MVDDTSHPYWHIKNIIEPNAGSIKLLNMSYYKYTPQTIHDSRKYFKINPTDFLDKKIMEEIFLSTPTGHELALHSEIELASREIKHIPMVDMFTGSAAQLEKLRPFLGEGLFKSFEWYKSGRSYHGYGSYFISIKEWQSLMGAFLLANQKGLPPTVDPRWVGHRLISGYSALRWTKNTLQYQQPPKKIVILTKE